MISIIKRKKYLSELTKLSKSFPVIGITGPRQVGKTTLVKQFEKKIKKETVFLDLERPSDYEKLNNPELYLEQHNNKCVIIDEIQIRPELFGIIRYLVDKNRIPLRFIILGSASPDIIKKSSETLAGRIAYIEIKPFNIEELNNVIPYKKQHFLGGFPESVLNKNEESALTWLDNFIKTYLERDLPMLGMPFNPILIRKLWEMLAWQNANILNYSSLSNSLGISANTVKNYIDFLEGAFLINKVRAFSVNIKKRIVKSPKIHIADTGILHRLLRINSYEILQGTPLMGSSWETFVFNQVYSLKNKNTDIFFYRTHAGTEVDIVLAKALKPTATIEIKYGLTPKLTKSIKTGISDLQTKRNFIIVPKGENYFIDKNIRVCNIYDFVTNYLPEL